ncbi:GrpB family protein [Brachybacterium sp. FME24]|uniref:GrpB family protein n=1 Tax=Brachybacterium sp. FME24 TaxID=2742605 RepID=UPI00186741CC|nr:GrpB family protein [Brachybacterium sp. FME24]
MPFDDEVTDDGVQVHKYRACWEAEGAALAHALSALVPTAAAVEHIGSTSIPGMAAKDCLDMMILVHDLGSSGAAQTLASAGYRRRPEPWNNVEEAYGRDWPKMVFAPPVGDRAVNIHVRVTPSGTERLSLLFRDHLRARPDRANEWALFKMKAAESATDLAAYGQIKAPAWRLLMQLAEAWATEAGWAPRSYSGGAR